MKNNYFFAGHSILSSFLFPLLILSCGGGGGGGGVTPPPGKTIGGAGNEFAWLVTQTADSGYVIAGTTNSKGDGGYDAYLLKTDATGSVIQEPPLGATSDEFCFSLQTTSDGGYIATGFNGLSSYPSSTIDPLNPELPRHHSGELFLIKMAENLTTTWTTTVSGTEVTGNTSYGFASGYAVQQTSDNGYIVAGAIGNAQGGGAGFLLKTNQTGSILWTTDFGDGTLAATGVQEAAGGYVASVIGIAPPGYLVKVDSSGLSTHWTTTLSGKAEAVGKADGGYIVTGTTATTGDVYLAKVDSGGNLVWTQSFGSPGGDTGYSVQETADRGFIIAGKGSGGTYNGGFDVYLIKTDSSGAAQW